MTYKNTLYSLTLSIQQFVVVLEIEQLEPLSLEAIGTYCIYKLETE